MLFTTDLDGTIIFSESQIKDKKRENYILVDKAKKNSYIHKNTLQLLKELNKMSLIIPVTSRTVDVYKRVNIPDIHPEYAICSGGCVILKNGKEIKEWSDFVKTVRIRRPDEIISQLIALGCNSDFTKIYDNYIIKGKLKEEDKKNVIKYLDKIKDKENIRYYIEKTKLYIMPKGISKGTALNWLKNKLGENFIMAAGNAEADIPMLEVSNISIFVKSET